MKIWDSIDNDTITVFLDGVVDETASPDIEKVLNRCIEGEKQNIEFDMGEVTHMSSVGICLLISYYKKAKKHGKNMRIARISGKASDILNMVGILSLFMPSQEGSPGENAL